MTSIFDCRLLREALIVSISLSMAAMAASWASLEGRSICAGAVSVGR
jgi:hypothetical protein